MVVVSCLGIDFHSINPLQLMPFPSKPTPSIISIFKISWPHLSTTHSFLNHQSHIASLHPWFELHSHFSSHQVILSCQFAELPIDALSLYFFVYASWRLVINELSKPQCLWQKTGFRIWLQTSTSFILSQLTAMQEIMHMCGLTVTLRHTEVIALVASLGTTTDWIQSGPFHGSNLFRSERKINANQTSLTAIYTFQSSHSIEVQQVFNIHWAPQSNFQPFPPPPAAVLIASLFNQPSTHSLLHTAHPHIYSLIQSTHSFLSKRVHSVIVHTFFRMCFACLWVTCLWVHHCLTMGRLSPKENQVQGHCQCLIYCQQPNGPSLIYFNLLKSIHVYAKAW